jgi:hypothetical protein
VARSSHDCRASSTFTIFNRKIHDKARAIKLSTTAEAKTITNWSVTIAEQQQKATISTMKKLMIVAAEVNSSVDIHKYPIKLYRKVQQKHKERELETANP